MIIVRQMSCPALPELIDNIGESVPKISDESVSTKPVQHCSRELSLTDCRYRIDVTL